jgi:hypothetical protein
MIMAMDWDTMGSAFRNGNTPQGGEGTPSTRSGQGVSDALRNAYRGAAQDLPEDLRRLLAKLR